MNPEDLAARLEVVLGGGVRGLRRLSGGASRETWAFDLREGGGAARALVVQLVRGGLPRTPLRVEAGLLAAARDAGVPVAGVVAVDDDPGPLGLPFVVLERVEGETIGRRILRDAALGSARAGLVRECAQALARVHGMTAPAAAELGEQDPLGYWRTALDGLGEAHPAFELALRWLERNRPPRRGPTVVHGDFRLGNLVVGPAGLAAVLDWELAHRGDPLEDLGWLCVRAWRFGGEAPVAGLGTYDELVGAYEDAGGGHVEHAELHWWETLGTLKWGVICIMQARRHLDGLERSVELATIGRRVCENEWDVLLCLDRAAERVDA